MRQKKKKRKRKERKEREIEREAALTDSLLQESYNITRSLDANMAIRILPYAPGTHTIRLDSEDFGYPWHPWWIKTDGRMIKALVDTKHPAISSWVNYDNSGS